MTLRIVEKLAGTEWLECRMKDIRSGDVFRLFDDEKRELPVGENWIAKDDASIDPETDVWGVECEEYV